MAKPKAESSTIDRFPGSLEAVTWRKSSQDFAVTMAVPQEMRGYIKPLMDKLNLYFVSLCIPVTDAAQAKTILESEGEDIPTLPATDGENSQEVTAEELADWFVIKDRDFIAHIHYLFKKNVVVKIGRGRYALKKSVQGYINEIRQTRKGNDSYHEERAKKLRINNDRDAIRLAKEKKELVRADAVIRTVEGNNANIKGRLLGLPTKLAPVLAGQDEVEVHGILDEHIRECLAELVGLDVAGVDSGAGEQNIRPAAETEPERVGGRKKGAKRKNKR